jgi:hypothetical protein
MESTREPATTQYISTSATPTQPSGYEQRTAAGSPAMFPGTMFPSFMQPQQVLQPMQGAQPAPQEAEKKMAGKESRDELVELAAILMALRLVSR